MGPYYRRKPVKQIEKPVEKPKKFGLGVKKEGKSYAEVAREEARADLKKKRSASYLTKDITPTRRLLSNVWIDRAINLLRLSKKENPGEFVKI